jgi:hypothetical protein
MNVREAKDFLVQQTVEQAQLEQVPLSDLERRMMYFTETGECPEDPIALNEAFEAEYDTAQYEEKVSGLMVRAYHRIKQKEPGKLWLWRDAVRLLAKGDHYILVFCPRDRSKKSPRMWGTYLLAFAIIAGIYAVSWFFLGSRGAVRRGEQPPVNKYLPVPGPLVQHLLQALLLLVLILGIFPQLSSKITGLLQHFVRSISSNRRQS